MKTPIILSAAILFGAGAGASAHITLESRQAVCVASPRVGKHLDGDVPLQTSVAGTVDLAHASHADQRDDFIGSEASAGQQAHDGSRLDVLTGSIRRLTPSE